MILFATQWSRLESGSLNLRVSGEVLDTLKTHEPTIEEEGSTVHYPKPYQHIPELRKKYLYYFAIARANDTQAEVLVRRAENPVPNRLELFAEVNLRDFLGVQDGDELTVEIK